MKLICLNSSGWTMLHVLLSLSLLCSHSYALRIGHKLLHPYIQSDCSIPMYRAIAPSLCTERLLHPYAQSNCIPMHRAIAPSLCTERLLHPYAQSDCSIPVYRVQQSTALSSTLCYLHLCLAAICLGYNQRNYFCKIITSLPLTIV